MQAFRATGELHASPKVPKVTAASEADVNRVLGAKSDHEVMQLMPGTEVAAVKKKYRSMTLALHPDKCKVRETSTSILYNDMYTLVLLRLLEVSDGWSP